MGLFVNLGRSMGFEPILLESQSRVLTVDTNDSIVWCSYLVTIQSFYITNVV